MTALLSLIILLAPSIASAHNIGIPYWGGGDNPILSCTGQYLAPDVPAEKKCTSVCDIIHTLQHTIYFGITLVLFALAPIMFIAGGIMVVLGGANPAIISTGRTILWRTVIGVAIALGSFLIVATFLWLVGNKGTGGVAWPQINCANPPGYQVDPTKFQSGYTPTAPPSTKGQTQRCTLICYDPNTECRIVNGLQACVKKDAPQQPAPQACDPIKPAGQQGCPAGKSCVHDINTGQTSCK